MSHVKEMLSQLAIVLHKYFLGQALCTSTLQLFATTSDSFQNATIGNNSGCDPAKYASYCNGPIPEGSQYR